MEVAVGAAWWVVGKALSPVADGLLEAWAASKQLGPNTDALKMELLYAQGMLNNTRGREIDNTALNVLLQKLRDLAYNAEDVLDELDYFRIQDQLEGTYEAANEHAKGCVCNLFLHAHHAAKAVGKLLCASPCSRAASHGDPSEPRGEEGRQQVLCCAWPCAKRRSARDNEADEEGSGCMRTLASGACNTIRDIGKRLHCSSLPLTHHDDDNIGMPVLCGARNNRKVYQKNHVKETPKLEFNRADLSERMKHIIEQLQPVCAKVTAILNLELLGSSRSTAPSTAKSPPTTTSDIIDSTFYGRDPIKKSIIDSIVQGNCGKYLTVLPIVGSGGIGKTTLVQHIYHSQEVRNHFQVKVWVCVSQNFNVNKLTEEIKKAISSVDGEKEGTSQELIEQRLKSKRLLLILDDIWKCESEDWNRLLVPLGKGQARGNIILVTTRFPAVAEMVKTTDSSRNLKGLEHEVFRNLFQAYIFGDEQSKKDHDTLLEIGDNIAEKLKGNPLAAKTVGTLLRNHLDLNHWKRVLESREWEMQNGEHDIMPALKLSYDYLPFHLQQCFSYCALFPEDHKFYSEELIHFWIGLDILQSCGGRNKTVEDVGLGIFNDLVNHGFFKKDETDDNPHYFIHDLLHDLALKVASHECLSLRRSTVRSVEIRPSIRHLSIIIDGANDSNGMSDENFKNELRKLKTRLKVETLQTLIIFGEHDESFVNIFGDLFEEANALRVLCLPSILYPVEFMLHKFSALLHLRYLRLETIFGRKIHLPSSLSRFYHLRVLHLKAYGFYGDLPRDMSNLAKLCHFLTDHDELHSGIYNVGKLQFLQELKKFQVKKESDGFELEQLGHLMELRELGIYNLEKIQTKEEAAKAKLIDKNHLHRLTLDWESNIEPDLEALVLESLRPNYGLQELRIRGHGGHSCPTWLGSELSLKALKSLHLVGVGWNSLPSFGQMWMLNELKLEDIATLSEFGPSQFGPTTEQTFHNLKSLTLIGLKRLEKLIVGVFSGLQVLVMTHCPELLEFPFLNNACYAQEKDKNIHWLPKLREFEIDDCPKLLSLPPIPYTHTLRSVKISGVGNGLERLRYSDQSFSLTIEGNETLHSLDDTVLAFHNLNKLKDLAIIECPPLAEKHLRMLTLLKNLDIDGSSNVFLPLAKSDVKWQLPIERLVMDSCGASGKELRQFLYHLPKLSELTIGNCEKITRLGVEADQQETTAPISLPAASAVKMEDTQATYQHQQISEEVVEEEVVVELVAKQEKEEEDGMLLLPAYLSDSLQKLEIYDCSELSLMASPTLPDGHKRIGGRGGEGESLQALRALPELDIRWCPKLLSAYKTSSIFSCCCPFPSSLRCLWLASVETIEPLSNLTSLTYLYIDACGEDLRWEGLWPLHTRGQLSELNVLRCPNFFVVSDPVRGLQDEQEQQLLPPSPTSFKLRKLWTDDVAGVLVAPVCSLLSSSLTDLFFHYNEEAERFTKEQEEALHLLTSLQELQFRFCDKLQCLPAGLNKLTNLKRLKIWSCPDLQSLPNDGLPISLQKLNFKGCGKLQCLPAGLNKLTNLKTLEIQWCPALRSLPKDGLPSSLQELDVQFCGNEELKQRCRRLMGTIPITRFEIGD